MSKYKKIPIPDDLRQAVFKRDGYTCRYCGSGKPPLHCDHIYPERHGGKAVIGNMATACRDCNSKKRDRIGIWPPTNEELRQLRDARYSVLKRDEVIRRSRGTIKKRDEAIRTLSQSNEVADRARENTRLGVQVYLLAVSAFSLPGLLYGIEHSLAVLFACIVVLWIPLICILFLKVYSRIVDMAVSKQVKQMNGVLHEVRI